MLFVSRGDFKTHSETRREFSIDHLEPARLFSMAIRTNCFVGVTAYGQRGFSSRIRSVA